MTKEVELGPFKMVGKKKEYLEPRFTVTIGTLNAADSLIADDYVGESANAAKAQKIYALCSIKKVNGKKVSPLDGPEEFASLLEQFDGPRGLGYLLQLRREFFTFANEAAEAGSPKDGFGEAPSGP